MIYYCYIILYDIWYIFVILYDIKPETISFLAPVPPISSETLLLTPCTAGGGCWSCWIIFWFVFWIIFTWWSGWGCGGCWAGGRGWAGTEPPRPSGSEFLSKPEVTKSQWSSSASLMPSEYRVQCTDYRVQSNKYRVQFTVYRVHSTEYSLQSTLCRVHIDLVQFSSTSYHGILSRT